MTIIRHYCPTCGAVQDDDDDWPESLGPDWQEPIPQLCLPGFEPHFTDEDIPY